MDQKHLYLSRIEMALTLTSWVPLLLEAWYSWFVPYSCHLLEPHAHEDTSISVNTHAPSTCSKKAVFLIQDVFPPSIRIIMHPLCRSELPLFWLDTKRQIRNTMATTWSYLLTSTHRREPEIRRMQGTKFLGKISNTSYATWSELLQIDQKYMVCNLIRFTDGYP